MKNKMVLSAAYLLIGFGVAQAQERVPLPEPEGGGAPAPATANAPPPPDAGVLPPPSGPPQGAYPPPPPYDGQPAYVAPPVYTVRLDEPCGWLGVDGLLWWVKKQPLSIPIVTTGPGSEGANAGGLGQPGTTSLNSPLDYGLEGGARMDIGVWLDSDHQLGLDGSLFFLQRQSSGFGVVDKSGTGAFVINEPLSGAPFVTQVSAPGVETGGVFVNSTTEFSGGDLDLMYNLYRNHGWSINLFGGFRYLQLDESLSINANSTVFVTTTYTDNFGNVLATANPGSGVAVQDYFGTHNQFYAGQIGFRFDHPIGSWFVNGAVNLALGDTHEVVNINGTTIVSPVNGNPVALSGGNFATIQSGRYAVDRFAFSPEARLGIGYQLGAHIRLSASYDFIYLSSVIRPANQIDNTYDGVVHPIVPMASSSFWAQGMNLSLDFRF